jgi:hypothetical protein
VVGDGRNSRDWFAMEKGTSGRSTKGLVMKHVTSNLLFKSEGSLAKGHDEVGIYQYRGYYVSTHSSPSFMIRL